MKYKLLKDLPDGSKNGDTYTKKEIGYLYTNDVREMKMKYPEAFVENNKDWFEPIQEIFLPILSVTDNDGAYYLIIPKQDMAMYENTEKGKLQNGYFGYIENDIFYQSQKRKDKKCKINYAKEDNYIFNHKRIKDRIEDLKELENAFNAARKTSDEVIGRIESNDGDCGDLHKNLFSSFNDYMISLTSN